MLFEPYHIKQEHDPPGNLILYEELDCIAMSWTADSFLRPLPPDDHGGIPHAIRRLFGRACQGHVVEVAVAGEGLMWAR